MNLARFLLLAAATLMLGACSSGAPTTAAPASRPLDGARVGGPFSLTAADGRTVTDRDFAGKYRLMYFGYSFCPDVCPVDLNYLMLGLKEFERQDPARAARIQPIFITIDPERDTQEVVGRFAAQFHPRLIGLTGTPQQIADVAKAFLITYRKQPGSAPDRYLVAHTQLAYLMGPGGEPVALIPIDDVSTPDVNEGKPELVAAELARWVR